MKHNYWPALQAAAKYCAWAQCIGVPPAALGMVDIMASNGFLGIKNGPAATAQVNTSTGLAARGRGNGYGLDVNNALRRTSAASAVPPADTGNYRNRRLPLGALAASRAVLAAQSMLASLITTASLMNGRRNNKPCRGGCAGLAHKEFSFGLTSHCCQKQMGIGNEQPASGLAYFLFDANSFTKNQGLW